MPLDTELGGKTYVPSGTGRWASPILIFRVVIEKKFLRLRRKASRPVKLAD